MKYDVIGSYLPPVEFLEAKEAYEAGRISADDLKNAEDKAVSTVIERQLEAGLGLITSGEVRRRFWDWDFSFNREGITRERVDSGRIYQDMESFTDVMRFAGRIGVNKEHPFIANFKYLDRVLDGRASALQTLPSPSELYLRILTSDTSLGGNLYPEPECLLSDIAGAYNGTLKALYEAGCRNVQFDDTVCGRMCDFVFLKGLIQGGIDAIKLQNDIVNLLNASIEGIPSDMNISLYMSSGPTVVPEWRSTSMPDNIMHKVLAEVKVGTFMLPFNISRPEDLSVLSHLPAGKSVALGVINAHSPFPDDVAMVKEFVREAVREYPALTFSISPQTGFKVSSYAMRGLLFEDQWNKIAELKSIAAEL